MRPAAASLVPRRALVIDKDATTRETAATLLREQGFTVVTAGDGAEALTVFARDWYPLVIAGHDTPTLDGFEVASRLRVIALAPVYVILLTGSTDALEHERGYCAGVDQFLLLQNFPGKLWRKPRRAWWPCAGGVHHGPAPTTNPRQWTSRTVHTPRAT